MVRSVRNSQLNTVEDLKNSGFGRPFPRHGLKLLFWFANDCVFFDSNDNLVCKCHPQRGDYGFHHFGNFEEIVPVLSREGGEKYFEVGNLNMESYPEAQNLPDYVREDYDMLMLTYNRDKNRDRVIVRLRPDSIVPKVYVTEHSLNGESGSFDRERTHLLDPELIAYIRDPELELSTFLRQSGYSPDTREYLKRALIAFLLVSLLFLILLLVFLLR
ncbi:uncharacterized protein LOC115824055 [Chanos chanos]|uniref:Uncharacterized protein LOC115824055 n=1 Tax=Chanos chanos TaxID=29144 RepID=A0A6J2WI42_CHACN|nr:uncharacterized protein LOC115824055 [Chanos chanos]